MPITPPDLLSLILEELTKSEGPTACTACEGECISPRPRCDTTCKTNRCQHRCHNCEVKP